MKYNEEIIILESVIETLLKKKKYGYEYVSNREDFYNAMSKEWQESDEGVEFGNITCNLFEDLRYVDRAKSELNKIINNLK